MNAEAETQTAVQPLATTCPGCGHLIGAHSQDVGCMDSMSEGFLERDRMGFCPCMTSSLRLVEDALAQAWDEGAEATAEWIANNPSPAGIPIDPPSNPYEVEGGDES